MRRLDRGARPRALGLLLRALGLSVVAAGPAWAHMMPAQQGTLNVVGNGVFAVLSLPVSALRGVDDDGDGRLSPAELRVHEAAILQEVTRRLRIEDGDRSGRVDFLQLMAEPDDRDVASRAGSAHFIALMKTSFDGPPAALRLVADFWGQSEGDRQLTIKATRGPDAEVAVLTPRGESHGFFRSARQVLGDSVTGGVEGVRDHSRSIFALLLGLLWLRVRLGTAARMRA